MQTEALGTWLSPCHPQWSCSLCGHLRPCPPNPMDPLGWQRSPAGNKHGESVVLKLPLRGRPRLQMPHVLGHSEAKAGPGTGPTHAVGAARSVADWRLCRSQPPPGSQRWGESPHQEGQRRGWLPAPRRTGERRRVSQRGRVLCPSRQ